MTEDEARLALGQILDAATSKNISNPDKMLTDSTFMVNAYTRAIYRQSGGVWNADIANQYVAGIAARIGVEY